MPLERRLTPVWDLGRLPFHIGTRAEPTNGELPDLLPFALGTDDVTGALAQIPNPEVSAALERAYRIGSPIGTPLSAEGSGFAPLEDFLSFICTALGRATLSGLRVLEIGSGAGALLRALADRGGDVIGVEPGAHGATGPPVIAEPFRRGLFDRPFDLIVHYAVLEHIEDPLGFVRDQLALLEEGGVIAFSVPDCRHYLETGDISMLLHEHWSYFDRDAIAALGAAAGASVLASQPAEAAGALYSAWVPGASPSSDRSRSAGAFVERARTCRDQLQSYVTRVRESGGTLGIYAPARFINYQELFVGDLPPLRYFDDDPALEGRYYPPFEIPVESRASLRRNPVAELLVMSWTFGAAIARELASDPALSGTRVVTIEDVVDSTSA